LIPGTLGTYGDVKNELKPAQGLGSGFLRPRPHKK